MAVSTMFAGEDVTEYYAVIISILFVALYGIMTVLLKLAARKNRELLMVITCGIATVSYTHLDVYKRQMVLCMVELMCIFRLLHHRHREDSQPVRIS